MTGRRWLWFAGVASVVLIVGLAVLDGRMSASGGPGIVGFELAGSAGESSRILSDWGARGQDAARLSLWLDFLFLVAYGAFLTLAVLAVRAAVSRRGWVGVARAGGVVAVLPVAAAVFDAVENVGLLLVLGGHLGAVPAVAAGFALAKFTALAVAILGLLDGLLLLAVRPARRALIPHAAGRGRISSCRAPGLPLGGRPPTGSQRDSCTPPSARARRCPPASR